MNSTQMVQYRQLQDVIAFDVKYQEKLAGDVNYGTLITPIKAISQNLSILIPKQDLSGKTDTKRKHDSLGRVIHTTASINDLLVSYGTGHEFDLFSNIKGCCESKLARCKNEEVLIRANKLLSIVAAHPSEAEAAGVSADVKTKFEADIADYSSNMSAPKEFRIEHAAVTKSIDKNLENYQRLINMGLKLYMRSVYREKEPEMYAEFYALIQMDTPVKSTRAIQGTIVNANSGEVIRKVNVSIDGKKPLIKGGKTGAFYFQSLPPGEHELSFTKKGYQGVTRKVVILADQTLELDIELKPIEIEETEMA